MADWGPVGGAIGGAINGVATNSVRTRNGSGVRRQFFRRRSRNASAGREKPKSSSHSHAVIGWALSPSNAACERRHTNLRWAYSQR